MVPVIDVLASSGGVPVDAPFRFRHTVPVRFRDIDVGGHAHHAQALVYFEEARAAYWREIVGRSGLRDIDYIMAEAHVRWHERVLWPKELSVGVRVSRLGRRSFEMEYEVSDAEGTRLQSGTSIQVMYDYGAGATKPMPGAVRSAIEAFDGPFSRRGGIPGTRRATR
jgi:acyl-CoA thioester hydrolase